MGTSSSSIQFHTPYPTHTRYPTQTPYSIATVYPPSFEATFDEADRQAALQLAERLRLTVVFMQTFDHDPTINDTVLWGEASGFILSEDGFIATTGHNVDEDVDEILVFMYDGTELPAQIVALDEGKDVVLLKVVEDVHGLPFVEFGDSDALLPGETLMAISKPGSLRWAVVVGPFLRFETLQEFDTEKVLFSKVPSRSGLSGSAVFNMEGDVVGLVSGTKPDVSFEPFSPRYLKVLENLCYSYEPIESIAIPSKDIVAFITPFMTP